MSGDEKPKRRGRPPGSGRKGGRSAGKSRSAPAGPVQGELFQLEDQAAPRPAGKRRSAKSGGTGGTAAPVTPKKKREGTGDRSAPPSAVAAKAPVREQPAGTPRAVGMAPPPRGLAGRLPRRWLSRLRVGSSLAVIGYVAAVLFIDAMASAGDDSVIYWSRFQWTLGGLANGLSLGPPWDWRVLSIFDLYKALFWLVLPLAWSLPRLERSWFSWRRLEKTDRIMLAVFCGMGLAGVMATRFIPSLAAVYPRGQFEGFRDRLLWAGMMGCWWLSWLPGWELLHRYVLLRAASRLFPKWGWVLIPVSETAYHLVKPWPETLGMAVFSVLATRYVLARRNLIAPLTAHFAIEAALALLMLL